MEKELSPVTSGVKLPKIPTSSRNSLTGPDPNAQVDSLIIDLHHCSCLVGLFSE